MAEMIDLHCHLLPGIDDGARDLETSLQMARVLIENGVTTVACTPHILPGLYANTGPGIRSAVKALQAHLDDAGLELQLLTGADNHIVPTFVADLASGQLLALGDTRYVLVEPPHHVLPVRLEELFFGILVAGYVPILTHPERLSWTKANYALIERLAAAGVWMQITSGALTGSFGPSARALAERMLDDGLVHILATDAHDLKRRPPDLRAGYEAAARRVGAEEARHLVWTRPRGIVMNQPPSALPAPPQGTFQNDRHVHERTQSFDPPRARMDRPDSVHPAATPPRRGFFDGLRRLIDG